MRDDDQYTGPDAGAPIDDGSDDLVIRRVSRELRAPVTFGAGFDAKVMAAVRAAAADGAVERRAAELPAGPSPSATRPGGARRAWAWVVRPRTVTMSPLAGLAIAAGLAAVMIGVARQDGGVTSPVVAGSTIVKAPVDTGSRVARLAADTGSLQQVQFVLVAPSAKSVALVGDFNDWNASATPLAPVRSGGVWTITVPLTPGRYTYNFVVDGTRYLPDPSAPAAPADEFGTPASVVTVAGVQS